MINTSVHYTPILHSPLGESPAAHTLSESNNAPLKPVEPATATERARLRAPRHEVDLEEKRSGRDSPVSDDSQEKASREQAREKQRDRERLEQDRAEITELAARDREVRAHEQAHVAVGGQYAGGARYQYQRGPDGVNYAVSGEVSIDVSKAATPEATIAKAQTVRRAALAPAEPSPQDLRVAAQATLLENQARKELAMERVREARDKKEAGDAGNEKSETDSASKTDSRTDSRSSEDNARDASPAPPSKDNAGFSNIPIVNSRLASGIDNTRYTSSRVGSFLDQLA